MKDKKSVIRGIHVELKDLVINTMVHFSLV